MTHSRPALKRLGNDFIRGYCALVEGEKDPRNLMISFSVIRVMLLEFDIVRHVEVRRNLRQTLEFPDSVALAGSLRHHVLLLSDHLYAAAGRPVRHLVGRPHCGPEVRRSCSYRACCITHHVTSAEGACPRLLCLAALLFRSSSTRCRLHRKRPRCASPRSAPPLSLILLSLSSDKRCKRSLPASQSTAPKFPENGPVVSQRL